MLNKMALAILLMGSSTLAAQTVIYNYQNPYDQNPYYQPYSYSPTQNYANQKESDQQIVQEIEARIRDDHYLAPYGNSIQIYSLDGTVTLTGRLESDSIRLRMGDKAKVRGVRQVINNIEVVHSSF